MPSRQSPLRNPETKLPTFGKVTDKNIAAHFLWVIVGNGPVLCATLQNLTKMSQWQKSWLKTVQHWLSRDMRMLAAYIQRLQTQENLTRQGWFLVPRVTLADTTSLSSSYGSSIRHGNPYKSYSKLVSFELESNVKGCNQTWCLEPWMTTASRTVPVSWRSIHTGRRASLWFTDGLIVWCGPRTWGISCRRQGPTKELQS